MCDVLGLDPPKRREQRERLPGVVAITIQFGDDTFLMLDVPLALNHRFLGLGEVSQFHLSVHRSCPEQGVRLFRSYRLARTEVLMSQKRA